MKAMEYSRNQTENEQDKRMSVYNRTKEQVVRGQLNLDVDPLWRPLPWDRQYKKWSHDLR